jgi:hypothetical protein
MVNCGVFFAVRTEFLNNVYRNFGLKGITLVLLTLYRFMNAYSTGAV